MHPTFDLGIDDINDPLPPRPTLSATNNVFSLVERFTFRSSAADPGMFKVPPEIQYWAGVIMRNACRKDEQQGGIRQCAHMSCGRWEKYAREFAKCRRCRKAKYCSKDCQSKAWAEGHRFWCNARSDDNQLEGDQAGNEVMRAALEASADQTNDVMEYMPTDTDMPRDILQRAILVARTLGNLTTTQLATGTRNALANVDATEIDPRTIAHWVWTVLTTGLHGRSADDRNHFYRVVRNQPDILRGMFVQSMTHPRALQEGIEPVLRRRPQPQPQPQPQPRVQAQAQPQQQTVAQAVTHPVHQVPINPTPVAQATLPRTVNPTATRVAPAPAPQPQHPHLPQSRIRPPTPTPAGNDSPHRARTVTNLDQPATQPPRPANPTFAMEWNRYLSGQAATPPPHPATAAAAAAGPAGAVAPQGTVSDPIVPTQATTANRFGGRAMLSGLFGRMGTTRPNGAPNEDR